LFILLNTFYEGTSLRYVHIVVGIFSVACGGWIWCTISLGRDYAVLKREWEEENEIVIQKGEKSDPEKN
jgi:hypothetical protein